MACKDNFEMELNRVKEKIRIKFSEMLECLKKREDKLINEIDKILVVYHSYRYEGEKLKQEKRDLEDMRTMLKNQLEASTSKKEFQQDFLQRTESQISAISIPTEPKMVSFECDNSNIMEKLSGLGKLIEKVVSIDYSCKLKPLLSMCEIGNGKEQLCNSHGLCVDNTNGNIYVADQLNNCIKVFSSCGEFLFKFGDTGDEGKMSFPRGLAICGDRIVITQNCLYGKPSLILVYDKEGKFVSNFGMNGKGEREFNLPCGITFDEINGDIYVCDCGNNRVKVLANNFTFKSQFGNLSLLSPRDVKLSKEYIHVLDVSNPCLHLFDYNHQLHTSVISRGPGMQVMDSFCFHLDNTNKLLVSDVDSNAVLIFNNRFELVHRIAVPKHPMGISVDNMGRVIVVNQAEKDCLQIF